MIAAVVALSFVVAAFAVLSVVLALRSAADRIISAKADASIAGTNAARAEAERRLAAQVLAHDEDTKRLETVIGMKNAEIAALLSDLESYAVKNPDVVRDRLRALLLGGAEAAAAPPRAVEGVHPAAGPGVDSSAGDLRGRR